MTGKRFVLFALSALLLCSCGPSRSSLYYWGGTDSSSVTVYEKMFYNNYKKQTDESICRLLCTYEDMIKNAGGLRQVPPPGICAEYGYMLINPDSAVAFAKAATPSQRKIIVASDYAAEFGQRGMEMLQREMELYPESVPFIMPLVKKWRESR